MNFFVFWKNEQGETELVTPPLNGTILPGVTRDSILKISKDLGEFKVSEREFTVQDMIGAIKEKRMIEAFGAGTACVVCPVQNFNYGGVDYDIPIQKETGAGELTQRMLGLMEDIYAGKSRADWMFKL